MSSFNDVSVSSNHVECNVGNSKRRCASSFEPEEQEEEFTPSTKLQRRQPCYAPYRKTYQNTTTNKITAEKGLMHDFKGDFHYLLTTLLDEKSSINLKQLSLMQLVRKSVSLEFRDFLRIQSSHMNRLFTNLAELVATSPTISLSSACLLYFMARDRKGIPVSEQCIRLIAQLLKQDNQRVKADEEYKKHLVLIWSVMQDWLRFWLNKSTKSVKFDVTEDNLSVPFLTLEALAYIALKEQTKMFKSEMYNSGCLTTIVAKLDKAVLELVHSNQGVLTTTTTDSTMTTSTKLKVVERCYRILENAAAFDTKNQVYLVQHRNNLLIFSCAKFLNYSLNFIENVHQTDNVLGKQEKKNLSSTAQNDCNKIFDCICLLCRVLMNVSHESENGALKIGQAAGFLQNCLNVLAKHSNYAPKEKFFDLAVMMYGLLVNLLEKCPANRRKFINLKSEFIDKASILGQQGVEFSSLDILTKLFIHHDSAAKVIDEEFDNELLNEEPPDEDGGNENGQEKAANMSQDEVLTAIQTLMNKASTHMEDSMVASYCSLVVAIVVGTDNVLASQVKALMPNKDITQMLEQLERFLDFMRITNLKASTVSNIERVLNSFQTASNSSD
uniref:WAPL domain-containing protein n=1 Tax=Meloidogyne incognita TaxID=6306 RepID=A0A914N847_MELIC